MRYLFRFEAEHLLARAGFEVEHLYADFDKRPYGSAYPGSCCSWPGRPGLEAAVLLKQHTVEGIANGVITLLFRRWVSPRVKPGSSFVRRRRDRCRRGGRDHGSGAHRQGRATGRLRVSRGAAAELSNYPDGRLYRIAVRLAGADPRVALRENAGLSDYEVEQLEQKLATMGARSKDGPWAMAILRLIEQRPGMLAARLAKSLGMETGIFKPRVRQLKELGLTESLEIGYRLSPRGEAVLRRLIRAK